MITICFHKTQGLLNDAKVLQHVLSSYKTRFIDYEETELFTQNIKYDTSVKDDIVIFLEHINKKYTQCKYILFFPNYEILNKTDFIYMHNYIDLICAKNEHTKNYLTELGFDERKIAVTGFTSIDRSRHCVKQIGFLHVKGKSSNKNTQILINTWIQHPEWPVLHIVQEFDYEIDEDITINSNIILTQRHISENELNYLMNLYKYHLCPSQVEGFGHYINEGLSCSSVVITSNAPPMNELINEENGILMNPNIQITNLGVIKCLYSISDIEKCVKKCLTMSEEEYVTTSTKGYDSFTLNHEKFVEKINLILNFIYNDAT